MNKTYLYVRVSTNMQSIDSQEVDLMKRYPLGEMVPEVCSGTKYRPKLRELLKKVEHGDTIVISAFDRLGRKLKDSLEIIADLTARGVNLISLRENVDYSTPNGRFATHIHFSVAELERENISLRTKAGLRAAKNRGVQLGRRTVYGPEIIAEVKKLRKQRLKYREIKAITGMSVAMISAIVGERKGVDPDPE
jgi:DNA invertase Pin-like site-specific DNA recombinase